MYFTTKDGLFKAFYENEEPWPALKKVMILQQDFEKRFDEFLACEYLGGQVNIISGALVLEMDEKLLKKMFDI